MASWEKNTFERVLECMSRTLTNVFKADLTDKHGEAGKVKKRASWKDACASYATPNFVTRAKMPRGRIIPVILSVCGRGGSVIERQFADHIQSAG